jgi:hypothetical protein
MNRFMFPVVLVCVLSAGCANTAGDLQRGTARYLGDMSPDHVKVSHIKRGITDVEWEAETPNGVYRCLADEMVRHLLCVKR